MNILVSACLLGACCRYDAKRNANDEVLGLIGDNVVIPVCPEQLGGLPTPRPPAERLGSSVVTKEHIDVTEQFEKGAAETVRLAKLFDCRLAVLKSNSPSCGCGQIYDGTFANKLIPGDGVTAQALKQAGVTVISERRLDELNRMKR